MAVINDLAPQGRPLERSNDNKTLRPGLFFLFLKIFEKTKVFI